MNVTSIYAYIEKLDEWQKQKLLELGWLQHKRNPKYFYKEIGPYKLEFVSREFADQIYCSLKHDEPAIRHVDSVPFDFLDAWNIMWSKNITLLEIHLFSLENQRDQLLQKNWEPNEMFPETMLQYKTDPEFLYTQRHDQVRKNYFELQDATAIKALDYPKRLIEAGVITC